MTVENEPHPDDAYQDPHDNSPAEKLNRAIDEERAKMSDAITNLSKIATLTIADTYSTEGMGVAFAPGFQEQIIAERNRLNQNLGEVARLWTELNVTISEVQRGVGSLQYMIDPENN